MTRLYPAFFLSAIVLLAHTLYISQTYPFVVADDSFISLRYAQRLLEGKGLTWNDGERVEGYSNLLWVLLNAGLGYLGVALSRSAQWLGLAAGLLTLPVFYYHAREAKLPAFTALAAGALFAVTAPVALWIVYGMETPLVMALFAWAMALGFRLMREAHWRHVYLIGAALALLCLLRPEGPLYTIALAAGFMLFSQLPFKTRLRMAVVLCAIPLAAFLCQLGFRLYYYHQWLPNTVMAKVAFTPQRLAAGLVYTLNFAYFFAPLIIYCAMNLWGARGKALATPARRFLAFLLTIAGILSAAIIVEGGDFFPCFRAFIPILPALLFIVMHALVAGVRFTLPKKEMIFFGCVFAFHLWQQMVVDQEQLPKTNPWIEDATAIGLALKDKYAGATHPPTIAVFAAGAIPFYSQLPSLDLFGLNDQYLTTHRKANPHFGKGLIGHELFDAAYVESKKPDIVILEIPGFYSLCAAFKKECEILKPHYRPEILRIPGNEVTLWVRRK